MKFSRNNFKGRKKNIKQRNKKRGNVFAKAIYFYSI